MKDRKLLTDLSKLFLSYRDMDKGYFKILRIIRKLAQKGIYLDIYDIQVMSYKYKGGGK